MPVTFVINYEIDPSKIEAFETYSRDKLRTDVG